MRGLVDRLDRAWSALVPAVAAVIFLAGLLWGHIQNRTLGLENLTQDERSSFYSALAGVAAGILGFTIAAVAILIAMPKNPSPRFGPVRRYVVSTLLSTSLLVGFVLAFSILGMVIDRRTLPPLWLQSGIVAGLLAAALGLGVGCLGLAALLRVAD
jgi:hypothetical protein